MQTPVLRHHNSSPNLIKKSFRCYDFRIETDLESIHDNSTEHNSDSPEMSSPFDLSDCGSPKSAISASHVLSSKKETLLEPTLAKSLSEEALVNKSTHSSSEIVLVAPKPKLWKSQCFIEILKFFFTLHDDIAVYDLAKLQLLNKKCYDYFVPRAM